MREIVRGQVMVGGAVAHPADHNAPDRLIESLFAACFRFCGVLGLGWCRCETRRRVNSAPLAAR